MTDEKERNESKSAMESRWLRLGEVHDHLHDARKILKRIADDDQLYEFEGSGKCPDEIGNAQVLNILESLIYFNLHHWARQKDVLEKECLG